MTAQHLLFLDIRPLWSPSLLMLAHPFTKLVVPDMGRSQIDRMVRKTQRQLFRLTALT